MTTTIILRTIVCLLSLSCGFFCIGIYTVARNSANKGWIYMAFTGGVLSLWSFVQTIGYAFGPSDYLPIIMYIKTISSIVCCFLIGILVPLSIIKLNETFNFKMPLIFTKKNIYAFFTAMYVIFLSIYFITHPITDVINLSFLQMLKVLAGVANLALIFIFTLSLQPAYILWKNTKVWIWLIFFMFIPFVIIAQILNTPFAGCCNQFIPELAKSCNYILNAGTMVCRQDLAEIIPIACSPIIIGLSKFYQLFMLVAVVLGTVSFYGIWKTLKAMVK